MRMKSLGILCFLVASLTALGVPVITRQPLDQIVDLGASTNLFVNVTGVSPFQYQWFFKGVSLEGATNRSLSLRRVQPSEAGDYVVVISDSSGSVTSRVARLGVNVPAPHRISTISWSATGGAKLVLEGNARLRHRSFFDLYPVEKSIDLTNWLPLVTVIKPNSSTNKAEISDPVSGNAPGQFYRTVTNLLITPIPAPTGPYAVGIINRLFTDPSRTNRYFIKTNSSFMVSFWYPGRAQARLRPAPYGEPRVALQNRNGVWPDGTLVSECFTHAFENISLDATGAPYPVVFHATGATGYRKSATDNCEELASHGFIVVSVEPAEGIGSEFPDGRLMYGPRYTEDPPATPANSLAGRLRDIRFMLEQLRLLDDADPFWASSMDLTRLGIFAWSFGGSVAGEACQAVDQFKAAVFLDGDFEYSKTILRDGLSQPFLAMHAESQLDGWNPLPASHQLLSLSGTNSIICQIRGSTHATFGDYGRIVDMDPVKNAAADVVRECVLSFFKRHLRNQDDGKLTQPEKRSPLIFNWTSK